MADPCTLTRGSIPLLVSFPHAGTDIPPSIARRMTDAGLLRADTDWHLPQLYAFVQQMGGSTLVPLHSRYVIDLNRPPEDTNLYPGQDTTGLVPTDTFRKQPIYRAGEEPDAAEIAERRELYWKPYHDALEAELERLHAAHGSVVLWDAHSIASELPRFFEGRLPDLNLGTADGHACATPVQKAAEAVLQAQREFTHVTNGRFKGGYITRHYGRPTEGSHALQLEMCHATYMDEQPPFGYRPDLAARVQPVLRQLLAAVVEAAA
ncbi:N-formylglutamate deformylase [Piscinibacter sp. XHJ-5]|uniref:N-formylglutamate deformylase n=1 Tax=Piscinibacter sp. XHJ-5 TaxID=3037797 RepID=UPI0024529D78|nr:N-formylglutamate deformylase [Piscinibacter sp. XHJ-5]